MSSDRIQQRRANEMVLARMTGAPCSPVTALPELDDRNPNQPSQQIDAACLGGGSSTELGPAPRPDGPALRLVWCVPSRG